MGSFPATSQMRQDSVGNFFRNLEAQSGELLPTWNGELYLELHRGTYTTQSRNNVPIARVSSCCMTPNFWRRWRPNSIGEGPLLSNRDTAQGVGTGLPQPIS